MGLFDLFKKGSNSDHDDDEAEQDGVLINAQLNARVQPNGRGDYFEDPLDDVLRETGIGEVVGGGTQMAEDPDGIAFCDVAVLAEDDSEITTKKIIDTLEKLGAPKGSKLEFETERDDLPFGQWEGLGLYLNGTDLDQEVYDNSDSNEIVSDLEKLLKGVGEFRGYWNGEREIALYFYGSSFEKMNSAMASYIADTPACHLARIEQIA